MALSYRAEINPRLLIWARDCSRMDIVYASKKLGVDEYKLREWETGEKKPTIKQLREVAKVYKVNFGAFFLPEPPESFKSPVKDFRRHHESTLSEIMPEIYIDMRVNMNAREVLLELEKELGEEEKTFSISCSINDTPNDISKLVRDALNISFSYQKTFREPRVAFNKWRDAISNYGCLVLQSTKISLGEMRGYSIFYDQKPIIVVNRKDPYSARIFTMLHELTHLLLRSSGLCDLHANTNMSPHEQELEVFCNKVAAQILVPDEYLMAYPELKVASKQTWTDEILYKIAKDFGVSREVILRKILDYGLTTRFFYEENRERFKKEAIEYSNNKKSKNNFLPPSTDVISAKGKKFVSVVFDALNSSIININDASDYLGVKSKHFSKIEMSLEK